MLVPRYVRVILLGVVFFIFILLSLDSVYADSEEVDVSIGFDFSFGELVDDEKTLSGTVISSREDVVVSWDIQNSTGFRFNWGNFNDFSENLIEISEGYFSLDWGISINSNDYYSCSCQFNIYVEHDSQVIFEDNMPFFILNEAYTSDSPYSLLISNPRNLDWINGDLTIEAQVTGINGIPPSSIQVYLKRYVTFAETCNSEITYSDDHIINPIYDENNEFSHYFDMNSKPDGWYELTFLIPSEGSLSEYDVYSCMSLKLNNLAPVISIFEEPSDQFESNLVMRIDASSSEDPIWSEDDLYYIWTCTSSESSEILIHEGFNKDIFELNTQNYSFYTLKLEIMDKGGLSSFVEFNFTISNMLPSSNLLVNGAQIVDGDEIELLTLENIIIDGSNSVDTENDIDSLRCIWSINAVIIFEGCNRELIWPEDKIDNKALILRLDVMDDDGAYSSVSVKLINPNASDPLPYPMIILFISFLFLISSVFYRFKKDSETSSIPKWTKGK